MVNTKFGNFLCKYYWTQNRNKVEKKQSSLEVFIYLFVVLFVFDYGALFVFIKGTVYLRMTIAALQ